ncbi:MAG: sulfurtransferase TusA family protein [Pseudomonadota bacterium]
MPDQHSLSDPSFDEALDCLGLRCPLPVLKARKALQRLRPSMVLLVQASDPMAVVDVPHMAREEGHTVLHQSVEGDNSAFWIRRESSP